jgi:micrococcal nuclease
MKDVYFYEALVQRVVDGDTYDLVVDLGFNLSGLQRFRLNLVDTPETWRPKSEAERLHGEQATKFVKDLIEGKKILLQTFKGDRIGIYGRYTCEIFVGETRKKLSDLLIENKLTKREVYV